MTTKIEWTDEVWNPVTGCTKVSPGCKHCYAERMAKRLKAMGQPNYANGFEVTMHEHALELPLGWKKPQMIFVNSMSDLFHQDVPADFILRVFGVMGWATAKTAISLMRTNTTTGASSAPNSSNMVGPSDAMQFRLIDLAFCQCVGRNPNPLKGMPGP